MTHRRKETRSGRERRLAGTKGDVQDYLREEARNRHEAEKREVLGQARRFVEDGRERRESLGIDREATLERGERRVNNTVPSPPKPGSKRKPLPPMAPEADPGAPE